MVSICVYVHLCCYGDCFIGDRFDVHHLEDVDFLYFAHDKFLTQGWTPTKFDQSVHLLIAKN